jgi:hypothetical protein
MRLKLILSTMAVFAAAIFASEPADTVDFNVIHGNAYSEVDYLSRPTGGAIYDLNMPSRAPSVNELVNTPYRMYGKNLVYIQPAGERATASYAFSEMTSFIDIGKSSNFRDVGFMTLGIATKNLGIGLTLQTDSHLELEDETSPYYKRETINYGSSVFDTYILHLALPLGGIDLNTKFMYSRYSLSDSIYQETYKDANGKTEYTYNPHYYLLWTRIALSNLPSAKKFFWRGEINLQRIGLDIDSTYKSTIDPDSDFDYNLNGNKTINDVYLTYSMSYIPLRSANARVHLGLVTQARVFLKDRAEDKENHLKDTYYGGTLRLAPNLFAEYAFNENWMLWGGGSFSFGGYFNREKYIENWKLDEETKNKFLVMNISSATRAIDTGVRFSYNNIILECSLAEELYGNPLRGFDRNGTTVFSFGGIVTF